MGGCVCGIDCTVDIEWWDGWTCLRDVCVTVDYFCGRHGMVGWMYVSQGITSMIDEQCCECLLGFSDVAMTMLVHSIFI